MEENDIVVSNHWLVSLADLDDQQKYIASLKPGESYIVEGCAGSGKSVLAMIKFNQLCQNGKSPIYATMMRGLTDTIITEILNSTDEGMKEARDYVQRTMLPPPKRLCESNVISESLKWYSGAYHGKPWYYKCISIGTLYRLLTTKELRGNALVVDECQDLSYSDFCKIVQQKGVYNPICWYGDDDQQLCDNLGDEIVGNGKHVRIDEIHEKCFPLEARDRRYKLVNNYRISKNVARFVDEFQKIIPEERGLLSHSAQGRRTDRPYLCGYESWTRQIESLVEIIKNRKWYDGWTGHRTAIFVGCKNAQVEEIYVEISKALEKAIGPRVDIQRRHGETNEVRDDWVTADPNAAIIVSTPLSSKGCQFDSVFVLANTFGMDNGCSLSAKDLNAMHVAMTRSCGELFVFYVGQMPPAFDQIPTMLYETSVIKSSKSAEEFGLL